MTDNERGMTLIELLISISLLTVIMAGLITAMLLVFDTTDATRSKITDTSAAQLLTSYLVSDAQSADAVQPSGGCTGASGTHVLELRWTDAANSALVTDVQYVLEPNGTGSSQLTRYAYNAGCTQTDRSVIVRSVGTATCISPCADSARQIGLDVTALSTDAKTGNYSAYSFEVLGYRRVK